VLALILANGRGRALEGLTAWQAKAAVPFGGQYRIVDFVLSNCVNSEIRSIALLIQYKSQSLILHVHVGWGFLHRELASSSKSGLRSSRTASAGIAALSMPFIRTTT